ncbi:MAG: hypothetical protein ABIW76_07035, partial [Fibrobacteria bacterium]
MKRRVRVGAIVLVRKAYRLAIFHFSFFILTFSFSWAQAQDRDLKYNGERQVIEAARHLYRIEGDGPSARLRLKALLGETRNEEVRTQAQYLSGRIFDQDGERDSALAAYRLALAGKGLQLAEKLWLYKRLSTLSPSSIQPLAIDIGAKTGPARAFPGRFGKRTVYTLEFRGPPDGQWERAKEMGYQDENGDFHPLDIRLSGHEEVLDADADQVLVLDQTSRKVALMPLRSGKAFEAPAGARVEVGALLPGEKGGFMLVGAGSLRVFKAGISWWEEPMEPEGCAWSASPERAQQGILQCADNQVFLVDIRKKTLRPVSGITDKALQVSWEGEFLAVRYIDRFEIRKGAGFEIVKWGL